MAVIVDGLVFRSTNDSMSAVVAVGSYAMDFVGGPAEMSVSGFSRAVSLSLDFSASSGLSSAMTTSVSRMWSISPGTNKPEYRIIVLDVHGTQYCELENAELGPMSWGLSETGSFSFSLRLNDPKIKYVIPVLREVQVWRGGQIVWGGVVTSASATDTMATFECQTLDWYLTRRVIGLVPIPNQLKNGSFEDGLRHWGFTFAKNSIPASPPEHSLSNDTINGKNSLEIEGVAKVMVTTTALGADVLFATGEWSLTNAGKTAVKALIDTIPEGAFSMTVIGHTDNVPYTSNPGGNQWLSEQRAQAVADYIESLRTDATVTSIGKGESAPVASNNTASGREKNRRVEVSYKKTVEAKGHRQYATQTIKIKQDKAAKKKLPLTLVGWTKIVEYIEPSKDGWGVYMERRKPGDQADVLDTAFVSINAETPRERWTRMECSMEIPADDVTYDVEVRLYPPSGVCRWDEIGVWRNDQLAFFDTDQAHIVAGILAHIQDPAMGKSDLRLKPRTPATGRKRDREYPYAERLDAWEAIYDFGTLADGMDVTIDVTPDNRYVATHFPRKERKNHAAFTLGSNVMSYDVDYDGALTASTIIVQSEGEGADREEGVVQRPDLLNGLVLETVYNATPGSAISSLQKQAERGINRYGRPIVIPQISMRPDMTSRLMDTYELGDVVQTVLHDDWVRVDGPYRITGQVLDPMSDQLSYLITPEDV